MTEHQHEELVTVREAASLLHVGTDAIRLWLKKGVFPRFVRVGPARSIRLYRSDVLAQRQEQQTA